MTLPRNVIAKHSPSGVVHHRADPDSYCLWPACRTQATSGSYVATDETVTCRRCLKLDLRAAEANYRHAKGT